MKTFDGSEQLRGASPETLLRCMSHLRNSRARCIAGCMLHVSARLRLSLRPGVCPLVQGRSLPARGSAAETQKTCGRGLGCRHTLWLLPLLEGMRCHAAAAAAEKLNAEACKKPRKLAKKGVHCWTPPPPTHPAVQPTRRPQTEVEEERDSTGQTHFTRGRCAALGKFLPGAHKRFAAGPR